MISFNDQVFRLDTKDTTYAFRITEGYPEHLYYGRRVPNTSFEAVALKNTIDLGCTVKEEGSKFFLERNLLEYSGIGRGDYRHSPIELLMPDGTFVCDFVYDSHRILDGAYTTKELPTAYGEAKTLEITLKDKKFSGISLKMNYVVFEECNVICRNVELINEENEPVYIRKLMSLMLDFAEADYDMLTLDGDWSKEAHEHRRFLECGVLVNESTVGASSNKHNPAFALLERGADESRGKAYGFNLIYSGNHYSLAERSSFDTARVMTGINPHCFLWKLSGGESFVTPQAVMTYSGEGLNKMMENMHSFVNEHIVRGEHKDKDRPIVLNNWEATFFNFNRSKILALARSAKKLGVEMFVLDDGWFGKRNNDLAGLGDWVENRKKLPGGIKYIAKQVNKMGMKFGLWFEPECVNPDSDLYRAHPEWAIGIEGRARTLGRNQLTLDLTRPEVREYIIESVDKVLSNANIEYVKWDYNRHISDMYSATLKQQGEFFHHSGLGVLRVVDNPLGELAVGADDGGGLLRVVLQPAYAANQYRGDHIRLLHQNAGAGHAFQPGNPGLYCPAGVNVALLQELQLHGVRGGGHAAVSCALQRAAQTVAGEPGTAGDILRVAQLGRGDASPLEIGWGVNVAICRHHERGAAIHGSRKDANLAPSGHGIGIQRGAGTYVSEVSRAAEQSFHGGGAGVVGVPLNRITGQVSLKPALAVAAHIACYESLHMSHVREPAHADYLAVRSFLVAPRHKEQGHHQNQAAEQFFEHSLHTTRIPALGQAASATIGLTIDY